LSTEVGFAQKPRENQAELRLLQSEGRILTGINFYPSEIRRTAATVCQINLWSYRFGYTYFQEVDWFGKLGRWCAWYRHFQRPVGDISPIEEFSFLTKQVHAEF